MAGTAAAFFLGSSDDESSPPAAPAPTKTKTKPAQKRRPDEGGPAKPPPTQKRRPNEGGAAGPAKAVKAPTQPAWIDFNPRQSINTACEHFLCNLTQQIPFDPVMAMDGNTYEREALEAYFARFPYDSEVPSPVRRERMPKTMIDVPHIRAAIEAMVRSGMVEDAELWEPHLKAKAQFTALLRSAEADTGHRSSVASMMSLVHAFLTGALGQKRDPARALRWCVKAADQGCIPAKGLRAVLFHRGFGVGGDPDRGFVFATEAAHHGSVAAFFVLGKCLQEGFGTAVDNNRAYQWMWAFVNCLKLPLSRITGPFPSELATLQIGCDNWEREASEQLAALGRTLPPAERDTCIRTVKNRFSTGWVNTKDANGKLMPFSCLNS